MRAFVFGGGGSLGAMQIGALMALFEQGIFPDLLVGCSVGALNAAMMAHDYSWSSLERLVNIWGRVRRSDIYPGGKWSFLWRLLTRREGLVNNQNLYNYLVESGVDPNLRFGDLHHIPLLVTASNLYMKNLHVFGHSPDDYVLDALMASCAQPPYLAPWDVNGERFIDGGAVTPLPLRVAIEHGATEIYALQIESRPRNVQSEVGPSFRSVRGMVNIVQHSIDMMIHQQAEHDLYLARQNPGVKLHQVELLNTQISRTDFKSSGILIQSGYEMTLAHFEQLPTPRQETSPPPQSTVEPFPLPFTNLHSSLYSPAD